MITQEQYKIFLESMIRELEGDWVLIGGSLLAVINAESRSTSDIDLCSIDELSNEKRISLMKLAEQAGLSIESINPAADYFLKQIPNWKNSLVILQSGLKGNLYRPSLELYISLKLARATDTDIKDCISFLKWHLKNNINFDQEKIKQTLSEKQESNPKINEILGLLK